MKIIVGQGNPEARYEATRHNVGFMVCNRLADAWRLPWHEKPKFKANIAEGIVGAEKILLIKPTTYYNLTGECVRSVLDFYKLSAADVVVIHDELDLPFGAIRTRQAGGDAGNNGVRSLVSHIGPDFARIRIGIANEHREQQDAADFVLSPFSHAEKQHLPAILTHAEEVATEFVRSKALPISSWQLTAG